MTIRGYENQEACAKLVLLKIGEQVCICPPESSDAPAITGLLTAVASEHEFIPISESEITIQGVRKIILKMQKMNDTKLVVARVNDSLIGFAEMEREGASGNHDTAKLGIVVDKRYRGMGIGRVLIEFLVEQAQKLQIQEINLLVPYHNTGAITFYRKLGFIEKRDDSSEPQLEKVSPSTSVILMSRAVRPNSAEDRS